jgi:hypothetical protein
MADADTTLDTVCSWQKPGCRDAGADLKAPGLSHGICPACHRKSRSVLATEAGPDGYVWQLWPNGSEITLQRVCDAVDCDKGMLYAPARFCGACQGSGFRTRTFKLEREE